MKLNAFIERLAKKSGVDTTLLALPASVNDVEVPDDIANGIDKALMTVEAAKSNADVRKAIRTEALNGVDSKVSELLEELGIEDADDITGEKNSYEKVAKLARKVKELESKKAGADSKDKSKIEKEIADLNRQLKEAKDSLTQKENEWKSQREADLNRFDLHKKLLGRDYALPKEMDSDLKLSTAESAINKALQTKGFKLVRDAESGALKIVNKDGMPAHSDTHEPVEVDSFIDGVLAQNKLLKVNDPNPAPGGGNTQQPTLPGGGPAPAYQPALSQLDAMIAEAAK